MIALAYYDVWDDDVRHWGLRVLMCGKGNNLLLCYERLDVGMGYDILHFIARWRSIESPFTFFLLFDLGNII